MASIALNRNEAKLLNAIAARGAWFPLFLQLIAAIVLVVPLLLVMSPSKENMDGFALVAALPLLLLVGWGTGFFVVPKTLFKERRKGRLVPTTATAYDAYRWHWVGIFLVGNVAAFAILFVLELAGVHLSSGGGMSGAIGFATIYYANYSIAQRMLKHGDATLEMK